MQKLLPKNRLAWLFLAAGSVAAADDWPQWRGPARDGISRESAWSDSWPSPGPAVLWKGEVGTGFSSFAVAAGRLYTAGNASDTDTIYCLDAEKGTVLWKHAYASELGDKFFEGGPTATPTVDGDRVYAIGRWGDVFSFEASTGRIVWSLNLQKVAGYPAPPWGFGGSPFIYEDLVILNAGDAGLALEKATGKIVWKSPPLECGYSTPVIFRREGETLVLLGSSKSYVAVNPRTGQEAWRVKWITQYGVNAADPVVEGASFYISTGYNKGAAYFKVGPEGPQAVWQSKVMRTQMNPAVLIGGYLYGIDGDSTEKTSLKCVELATGAQKWSRPVAGVGSVSAADGKLIVMSGTGELLIGPASPGGFNPSAQASVLMGKCWTVPVLANGRLYCRSADGQVLCLDLRKR